MLTYATHLHRGLEEISEADAKRALNRLKKEREDPMLAA